MGVRALLAAVTFTGGDITQAESLGIDLPGMQKELLLKCDELTAMLNMLKTNVLTPASDAGNITTFNTQITSLA